MIQASHDSLRLSQLDANLRREADEFLLNSGLAQTISAAGFAAVGSYTMRTMVWRDLDFERMVEPDWSDHWALGQALAKSPWVWRLNCNDAYRDQYNPDFGHYWGLRASNPNGGPIWKVDLWTARPEEFAPGLERRATWQQLMTEDARLKILAIKEAICSRPEYRKTLLSVHVYEAVLERQVNDIEGFLEWWKQEQES